MTTKAYLGQARFLDMRIKSKIQQIDSLRFSEGAGHQLHGSTVGHAAQSQPRRV